jgi:hypothetical protein
VRPAGTTGGRAGSSARRISSTRAASSATVGPSKSARSGSSTANTSLTRETTRMASSECPPSSKKLASTPTVSSRRVSAQIPASTSSAGVRGATCRSAPAAYSGAGSALGSSLPFGVSGMLSSRTNAAGTMYSGRFSRTCPRSSSASTPPTTYATSRFSPGASSRATTTHSATLPCRRSTASTSPGSTRKPRTLTCWSMRPRNSRVPSAPQRARSPERYIRAPPSAANGSGTNLSAVSSARPR